MKNLLTGKYK